MRGALAIVTFGLISAAIVGGVWSWLRARDETYDDDRELAKYAARPPQSVTVPDDVELVTVAHAEPVDPTLLDVSMGSRAIRIHGREGVAFLADGGIPTNGLLITEIGQMLDWGRKLNAAVDASPYTANVLVDRRSTYARVVPLLYTMGQHEISDWNLVVRTPAGLGVLRSGAPRSGERVLLAPLCIVEDGLVFKSKRDGGVTCEAPFTADGIDAAAFRACYEKVVGEPIDAGTSLVVGGGPEVTFEQVVHARVGIESLGLSATFGATCK